MHIPFQEAVEDPKLLKKPFDLLSFPQQTILKALYGMELSEKRINPDSGWNELDYWAIIQGKCEYDDLGYVTKITDHLDYHAKEYNQLWCVGGRRLGKTAVGSFLLGYEATCGGHEEYISANQDCIMFLVAHKLPIAESNIKFVIDVIEQSPVLKHEIKNIIKGEIEFKNGIKICPSPATLKAQRGLACPVVLMDEVAFWYSDEDAANPDTEVERAIAKSQLQFPHYKRVGISSPWTKEGLLWKYHKAGTEGVNLREDKRAPYQGKLVCFVTTAAGENPALIEGGGRARLQEDYYEDPESFERECLCKFPDAVSGFIQKALLDKALDKGLGVAERARVDERASSQPQYIAAMDPAFRRDSFAFCVLHKDATKGIVLDAVRRWTPIKGQKLNPKAVLEEIKDIVMSYGVNYVYTDQHQLESLQELAMDMGFSLTGYDFTPKSKARIYGNIQRLMNQEKLSLLDPNLTEAMHTMEIELGQLERRLTTNGTIQVSAPPGKHDDMPTVLALAAYHALWMDPTEQIAEVYTEPSIFERAQQVLRNKHQDAQVDNF